MCLRARKTVFYKGVINVGYWGVDVGLHGRHFIVWAEERRE